jgi:ankyrin repeat protein
MNYSLFKAFLCYFYIIILLSTPVFSDYSDNEQKALIKAVRKGTDESCERVKKLCVKNPDLKEVLRDFRDGGGRTVLHIAQIHSRKYETDMIEFLAEYVPELITTSVKDLGTPLHRAVRLANLKAYREQLEILLKKAPGAVNCVDDNGITPLNVAVENSHYGAAKYLIRNEADISFLRNFRDQKGYTVLHVAQNKNDTRKIKFLTECLPELITTSVPGLGTPLHFAASSGDRGQLKILLKKAPEAVDCVDDNGNTPLYLAIKNSEREVKRYLIKNGAKFLQIKDSILPGTQVNGKTTIERSKDTITDDKWQIWLFFTKEKDFFSKAMFKLFGCALTGHTMIAFEHIDRKGDLTLDVVHLYGIEGIKRRLHSEENFKDYYNKHEGRNVFKWQIEAKKGNEALAKVNKDQKDFTTEKWKFSIDGTGKNNAHNCSSYALSILEECGIKVPKLSGEIPYERRILEVLS